MFRYANDSSNHHHINIYPIEMFLPVASSEDDASFFLRFFNKEVKIQKDVGDKDSQPLYVYGQV